MPKRSFTQMARDALELCGIGEASEVAVLSDVVVDEMKPRNLAAKG